MAETLAKRFIEENGPRPANEHERDNAGEAARKSFPSKSKGKGFGPRSAWSDWSNWSYSNAYATPGYNVGGYSMPAASSSYNPMQSAGYNTWPTPGFYYQQYSPAQNPTQHLAPQPTPGLLGKNRANESPSLPPRDDAKSGDQKRVPSPSCDEDSSSKDDKRSTRDKSSKDEKSSNGDKGSQDEDGSNDSKSANNKEDSDGDATVIDDPTSPDDASSKDHEKTEVPTSDDASSKDDEEVNPSITPTYTPIDDREVNTKVTLEQSAKVEKGSKHVENSMGDKDAKHSKGDKGSKLATSSQGEEPHVDPARLEWIRRLTTSI